MASQGRSELETVIGEVTASYREGRLIDSLSSAQLPNKRQVTDALGHLKAVMYLGYYATGALDESKLEYTIASHLYPAYEMLVEQIRRAANYEGFRTAGAPRDPAGPRPSRSPCCAASRACGPCCRRTCWRPSRGTRRPTASRR